MSEFLEALVQAILDDCKNIIAFANMAFDLPDLTEAYRQYAQALKRSVDSLTEAERKQAFLNVVLEQGDEHDYSVPQ